MVFANVNWKSTLLLALLRQGIRLILFNSSAAAEEEFKNEWRFTDPSNSCGNVFHVTNIIS